MLAPLKNRAIVRIKSILRPARKILIRLEKRNYRDTVVLDDLQTNALMSEWLIKRKAVAIGKVGGSEQGGIRQYVSHVDKAGYCAHWGKHQLMLYRNAGVYPADPEIHSRFARSYLDSLGQMDLLLVWYNTGERAINRQYAPQAQFGSFGATDPWNYDDPWTARLAGKTVLVVSPFAETIVSQYAKRREIWAAHRGQLLPDFDLRVIRAPLSAFIAPPEHPDWFAALDHLRREVDRTPSDVVLAGVGAWSIPLATHAKSLGRWAMHTGGSTQILFGIRGRRWDTHERLIPCYNDAWVRPGGSAAPTTRFKVEEACYW